MDKCQVGHELRDKRDEVDEWDMYNFSDWYRLYGSAYEEGIDDQTKIVRLLKEVYQLNRKIQDYRRRIINY
jgi:hypothetical protein